MLSATGSETRGGAGLPHGESWPSDFHFALYVSEKRPLTPRGPHAACTTSHGAGCTYMHLPFSSNWVQRLTLRLPSKKKKTGPSSSTSALKTVFGEDELGHIATFLIRFARTTGTQRSYGSNLASFYTFCDSYPPQPARREPCSLVDIARYIAWLGQRGTVAANNLQPYLGDKHDAAGPRPPTGCLGPSGHKST